MVQTLKDAFQNPTVQKVFKGYNTTMNTIANPLSKDTQSWIDNSKLPDFVKENYNIVADKAMELTGGVAGSAGLTFALRHKNLMNKGIDMGVNAVRNAGHAVNERIDDFVEAMHDDDGVNTQRGYENIVKYDNPSSENEVSMGW